MVDRHPPFLARGLSPFATFEKSPKIKGLKPIMGDVRKPPNACVFQAIEAYKAPSNTPWLTLRQCYRLPKDVSIARFDGPSIPLGGRQLALEA